MTKRKILAWFMIVIGLLVMLYAISSTYLNFNGQSEFPLLFDFENPSVSSTNNIQDVLNINPEDVAGESMESLMLKGANVFELAEQGLNMVAWLLFAFFMIYAGGKLIVIGVSLFEDRSNKEK